MKEKEIENRKKDRVEINLLENSNSAPEKSENLSNRVINKEIDRRENFNKLLLDLSLGIENIFREIGDICEITIRHESELTTECKEFYRQLPELAATLLLKGVAMELLDGDGLFVPSD